MMVFISPVRRWVLTFRNRDKLVAESFAPQTRRLRAWRWLRGWLLTAVVAGSVAWAIALPLVAYHFEQLTPWTVPFGILLAPFALLALTAGFFKIFFTTLCPSLAASWAGIATVPAAALRHLVHSLAHVPFSDLPMSRPPVWWIFLYYALLVLPLIPWPRRKVRWCARCGPAAAGMLAAFPLCVGFAALGSNSTELRVTLLSVGAGQCAVLEPSGGGVVIIDAGSSTVSDPVRTCFEPFLRHQQRRSVDSIFLSHGDYDHISAAQQIVSEYSVQQVLTSPHFRRHAHESKPCESLLATLDQTGHSPRLIIMGDDLQVGSDIAVQVLWPPANCPLNSNNTGLVLRVTCAGRSILFPADIQEPAERELLKHPEKLRSDILVAPHHGSAETTTAQFIAAVNPSTIVASSDSRLTKKQRTFDAAEKRWPIYRTGRCGAITIEIQKDGAIRVEPYLRSQIP
jgi:competence protein ComEC